MTHKIPVNLDTNWAELIGAIKVGGMTRELANNCILESLDDKACQLILSPEHTQLLTSRSEMKLEEALQSYLDKPIKLKIKTQQIINSCEGRQQVAIDSINIDWVKKAKDQYNRGRYQESILSADNAIQLDEDNVDAWWFSALSYQGLNNTYEALNALEIVIDLAPDFASGWARYGAVLQETGDSDAEALDAFERAVQINPDHETALTGLAELYRELDSKDHDDVDKEVYVLSRLDDIQGWLTSNQLNRLGILYYNSKRFFEAIKYWDRNIQFNTEFSSLFNLGLVYNHPEVSQDADAIDIWRLTLKHHPDRTKVKDKINELLPRLVVLAEEALQRGQTVLEHAQWYQNYINPFELINYQDDQLIDSDNM